MTKFIDLNHGVSKKFEFNNSIHFGLLAQNPKTFIPIVAPLSFQISENPPSMIFEMQKTPAPFILVIFSIKSCKMMNIPPEIKK